VWGATSQLRCSPHISLDSSKNFKWHLASDEDVSQSPCFSPVHLRVVFAYPTASYVASSDAGIFPRIRILLRMRLACSLLHHTQSSHRTKHMYSMKSTPPTHRRQLRRPTRGQFPTGENPFSDVTPPTGDWQPEVIKTNGRG
jgi:hypothetical protein